jgi:hypothetical protein
MKRRFEWLATKTEMSEKSKMQKCVQKNHCVNVYLHSCDYVSKKKNKELTSCKHGLQRAMVIEGRARSKQKKKRKRLT